MMKRGFVVFVLALSSATAKETVTGNLGRGEQDFRACASCHSLTPNHNMTGPDSHPCTGACVAGREEHPLLLSAM
jgi:cytochrome c2